MINYKKEKLIKKHLGLNTPDWIVQNCIEMLREFEDIALTIPVVSRSIGKNTHGVIKTVTEEEKEKFDICQVCKYKGHCGDEIYTVCRDELEIDQCYC